MRRGESLLKHLVQLCVLGTLLSIGSAALADSASSVEESAGDQYFDTNFCKDPKLFADSPIHYLKGDSRAARWRLFFKYARSLYGMKEERLKQLFGEGVVTTVNLASDRAEPYTHKIIQYVLEAGKNRADDILSISVIEVELSGGIVMSTTLRETGHVVLGSK